MQINSSLYSNFILDLYIVYEINNWPINCVVIFGVDNIPSSHTDNQKTNLLVLDEGSTYEITDDSSGTPEKKFSVNFSKDKFKFEFALHQWY